MPRETIVLHSHLPLEEFELRLHSVVERETLWNKGPGVFFVDKPVMGKFHGNWFRLNRRRRFVNNSFARMFYGRYLPEPGGVRIEGYFDIHPFSKWFMRVWLGVVILISVLRYAALLKDQLSGSRTFSELSAFDLMLLAFVAYGVLFPRFGQWISRGSEQFILDYLEENLVAHRTKAETDLPILDSAMR